MIEEDEELRQLYERFKAEIADNTIEEPYYEEDDLVLIYDIAGDYYDRYTQMRALLLGNKLYPNSEALELRLGFALLELYEDADIEDFLAKNVKRRGLMWDILRLRNDNPYEEEAVARLESMLQQYTLDDDEAIIQFIKTATQMGGEQWIAKNYKRIAEKSQFPDTVLFECVSALRFYDTQLAISIGEELTRIDPFNFTAWIRLAEMQRDSENYDDALQSVDYALALSPDSEHATWLKAKLLMDINPVDETATRLLQDLVKQHPDLEKAKAALAESYRNQGKPDLAEMLGDFQDEFTTDISEELLEQHINWMRNNLEDEDGNIILNYLRNYDQAHGLYTLAGEYIKLLYHSGHFEELCQFMERDRSDIDRELRLDPPSLPLYAAAQLRLGRYDEAINTVHEYLLKTSQVCVTLDMTMAFAGVKIVLAYIEQKAMERNYSIDRDPVAEALNH